MIYVSTEGDTKSALRSGVYRNSCKVEGYGIFLIWWNVVLPEGGTKQAIAHIDAFRSKIEKELPYLLRSSEVLKDYIDEDDAHAYYLLTVEFGIKTYRVYLGWCQESKALLAEKGE